MERIEVRLPLVVKKDGTRVPFDRDKLRAGVALACRKRPHPRPPSMMWCGRSWMPAGGASEVPSGEIGLAVLQALRPLDLVAYICRECLSGGPGCRGLRLPAPADE